MAAIIIIIMMTDGTTQSQKPDDGKIFREIATPKRFGTKARVTTKIGRTIKAGAATETKKTKGGANRAPPSFFFDRL